MYGSFTVRFRLAAKVLSVTGLSKCDPTGVNAVKAILYWRVVLPFHCTLLLLLTATELLAGSPDELRLRVVGKGDSCGSSSGSNYTLSASGCTHGAR